MAQPAAPTLAPASRLPHEVGGFCAVAALSLSAMPQSPMVIDSDTEMEMQIST